MEPRSVLITAGSRRVALVDQFRRALVELGVAGRVVVTDVNAASPAVHAADRAYRVPYAHDPDYIDVIAEVCEAERVCLVVPTIDDELEAFAARSGVFRRMGIAVAVSDAGTVATCNDKLLTCQFLAGHGVAAARSFLPDVVPADAPFPLFVKPRRGRGSVSVFPVRTRRELAFFAEYVRDAVVQQYLDGPEFTIDMLCDFEGRPLSIVPRERVVIRAGVTDRGRTVRDAGLIALAQRCAAIFRFRGAVNVQCRVVDGQPIVFEINPRFSGGIPLTVAAGAPFPRWLLELALGRDVRPAIGAFADGLWMSNYEASLFLSQGQLDILACTTERMAG